MVKVRIQVKTKHEKNLSKVTKQKRYIAQVLTALSELSKEEPKKAAATKKESAEKAPAKKEVKEEKAEDKKTA